MAITVRQASIGVGSASTTALATSFPGATVTGNGVAVMLGSSLRDATSVTDTAGNTYAHVNFNNFFSAPFTSLWVCTNITGGFTTVTANFSTGTAASVVAIEIPGVLTLDGGNSKNANGTNATTNAYTTTVANTIVFAHLHDNTITAAPAGWTVALNDVTNSFNATYQIFTSTQTGLNPQWTNTSGGYAACISAYTSTVTTSTTFFPLGRSMVVVPAPDPTLFDRRVMPAALLSGTTPAVIDWTPAARLAIAGSPLPGPSPERRLMPAALLPATGVNPSDWFPRGTSLVVRQPWVDPFRPFARRDYPEGLFPGFPSPPDPTKRAKERPFLERNPKAEPRRGARVADKLSELVNALIRSGELVRGNRGVWSLRSGGFVIARAPTALDDITTGVVPGVSWVDSTTNDVYICAVNTSGAAVWKKVS